MIAALFLRAIDNRGDVYLPYSFEGEWTDEEKQIVTDAIAPHVPEHVDAMFNNFKLYKFGENDFGAKRFTWDGFYLNARSAVDLAEKIAEYYKRRHYDSL